MRKKYLTPSTVELYIAPRVEGSIHDSAARIKYTENAVQFGRILLSKVNALIDVKYENDAITPVEALVLFHVVRSVVIETIQLN